MPRLSEIIAALQDDLDKNGDTENFGIGIAVGDKEKHGIYSYDGFQVIRDVNFVNGITLLVGNHCNE